MYVNESEVNKRRYYALCNTEHRVYGNQLVRMCACVCMSGYRSTRVQASTRASRRGRSGPVSADNNVNEPKYVKRRGRRIIGDTRQ